MPDLSLEWGADFNLSPTGDLALCDHDDLTRQRIERRLFTAERGYVWHLDYGAGLPQKIGSALKARDIEAVVRAQIMIEASVAQVPPPAITVTETVGGLRAITIAYSEALTGRQVTLNLSI